MTEPTNHIGKSIHTGPAGTTIRATGRWGTQVVQTEGRFWSDEAEAIFLDHLSATCNVAGSARATGFSPNAIYARQRRDAGFAERCRAALTEGYFKLETAMVRRATEIMEGDAPHRETPVPTMTVGDALNLLRLHRTEALGCGRFKGGRQPRPRSLDEMRRSLLGKLEAVIAMREEDAADGL